MLNTLTQFLAFPRVRINPGAGQREPLHRLPHRHLPVQPHEGEGLQALEALLHKEARL